MSSEDFSLEPKQEDLKIRSTEYLKAKKSITDTPEMSMSPDMSFTKKKSKLGESQISRNSNPNTSYLSRVSIKTPDPRIRGDSIAVTEAVTDQNVPLKSKIRKLIFPPRKRREMMISYLLWSLSNMAAAAYIFLLLALTYHKFDDMKCEVVEMRWLAVYWLIHALHVVRRIVLACFWAKGTDPSRL